MVTTSSLHVENTGSIPVKVINKIINTDFYLIYKNIYKISIYNYSIKTLLTRVPPPLRGGGWDLRMHSFIPAEEYIIKLLPRAPPPLRDSGWGAYFCKIIK